MKDLVIDLCATYPHLRDRHGIGERTSREARETLLAHGKALLEQLPMDPANMPDRQPRDYDDLPRPLNADDDDFVYDDDVKDEEE